MTVVSACSGGGGSGGSAPNNRPSLTRLNLDVPRFSGSAACLFSAFWTKKVYNALSQNLLSISLLLVSKLYLSLYR